MNVARIHELANELWAESIIAGEETLAVEAKAGVRSSDPDWAHIFNQMATALKEFVELVYPLDHDNSSSNP